MTGSPPDPAEGPEHFTPPPAEPLPQSAVRGNLVLAVLLSGVGCLLVMLVVVALALLLAAG